MVDVCLIAALQPAVLHWGVQPLEPQAQPGPRQDAPTRPWRQALAGTHYQTMLGSLWYWIA